MPIDAEPIAQVINGWIHKVYMPHWATCPFADSFKKGKRMPKEEKKNLLPS